MAAKKLTSAELKQVGDNGKAPEKVPVAGAPVLTLNDRERVLLKAIGDSVSAKLAMLQPGATRLEFPAPVLQPRIEVIPAALNHVTEIQPGAVSAPVSVNTEPIANAISSVIGEILTTVARQQASTVKALTANDAELASTLGGLQDTLAEISSELAAQRKVQEELAAAIDNLAKAVAAHVKLEPPAWKLETRSDGSKVITPM